MFKEPVFEKDLISQLLPLLVLAPAFLHAQICVYLLLYMPIGRYDGYTFSSILQKQQMDNCSP